MKTSSMKFRTVPAAQRAHAAAWMQEWTIDQKLDAALKTDSMPSEAHPLPESPSSPWPRPANPLQESFPAPGQIRLLPPFLVSRTREPLYVAILSEWEDNLLLAAPFSGFLHPATRGEWLTGRPEPPLAVLCPWCAVSVSPVILVDSWHIDNLTKEQREAAWEVFRYSATGAPLPEALQDRVGAPIIHPLDPRIRYQRRLSACLSPLVKRTAQLFTAIEEDPVFEQARRQMRMAAQDRRLPAVPLLIQELTGEHFTLHAAGEGGLLDPFHALPDSPDNARGRMALRLADDYGDKPRPERGDLASLVRCSPGQPEETLAAGMVLLPPAGDPEPFCLLTGAWDALKHFESATDTYLIIRKS